MRCRTNQILQWPCCLIILNRRADASFSSPRNVFKNVEFRAITLQRWLDFNKTESLGPPRDFILRDYEPWVLTESILEGCIYYVSILLFSSMTSFECDRRSLQENLNGEIHKLPERITWSELALRRWHIGGGRIMFSVYRKGHGHSHCQNMTQLPIRLPCTILVSSNEDHHRHGRADCFTVAALDRFSMIQ